jgi:hypothetical protein
MGHRVPIALVGAGLPSRRLLLRTSVLNQHGEGGLGRSGRDEPSVGSGCLEGGERAALGSGL